MEDNDQQDHSKHQKAEPIEEYILIGANHIGIVQDNSVGKTGLALLLDLELIQGMHQAGVTCVTLIAIFNRLGFWHYFVSNQDGIINGRMALNATNAPEMCNLIGKPLMAIYHINLLSVG